MILFYVLALLLIASAAFTVTQKSPVYSVVGLLVNFLALAALYFTLNAEFLGIIQIDNRVSAGMFTSADL